MGEEALDILARLYCNSLTVYSRSRSEIGVALSSIVALFNHSCVPNADWRLDDDGSVCVYALRNVRAGEELCLSYIDGALEYTERRAKLEEAFFFTCDCSACTAGTSWWTCFHCGHLNAPHRIR